MKIKGTKDRRKVGGRTKKEGHDKDRKERRKNKIRK